LLFCGKSYGIYLFVTCLSLVLEGRFAANKLLPRNQSLFDDLMALLQALTCVVARLLDEEMILEQFLGNGFRQKALVDVVVQLDEMSLLACGFRKLVENLSGGVVSLCTQDASAKY
jgi:hypothetical protein